MKKLFIAASAACVLLAGCQNEADIASNNVSQAADRFEVNRRIVFYNTQTDTIMLTMTGACALGNNDKSGELSVTCKTGPGRYHKEFVGLSRNVTYVVQQLEDSSVNADHFTSTFKPSTVIPDIVIR